MADISYDYLAEAIGAFSNANDQTSFLAVMLYLKDSTLVVPCNAVLSEDDQKLLAELTESAGEDLGDLEGMKLQFRDEVHFEPDILTDGENYYFPAFSSEEEMGEYGDHFSKVEATVYDVISMARNSSKDLSGIVINAFSHPFLLDWETADIIAGTADPVC